MSFAPSSMPRRMASSVAVLHACRAMSASTRGSFGGCNRAGNKLQSIRADLLRQLVGRRDQIRTRFDTDHAHGLFPNAVE